MITKNKRTGSEWETRVLKYLRGRKISAERGANTGAKDEGDLWFRHGRWDIPFVIECKAEKAMNLSGYVTEAKVEAKNWVENRDNEDLPYPIVVIKRRNHPVNKAYVVMELDDFAELILSL